MEGLKINIPPPPRPDSAAGSGAKAESLPKRPSLNATSAATRGPDGTGSGAGTPGSSGSAQSGLNTAGPAPGSVADGSPHPQSGETDANTPQPPSERERVPLRERLLKQMGPRYTSVEEHRLDEANAYEKHWKRWGPYLSERQWVSGRRVGEGHGGVLTG